MVLSLFVHQNTPVILGRWLLEVKTLPSSRGVPEGELIDSLPDLLRCIGDDCGQDVAILDVHLAGRLDRGFTLKDIVREFGILSRVIASVCEELDPARRPSAAELRQLDDRLAACMDHALQNFSRAEPGIDQDRDLSRRLASLVHADDDLPLVDLPLLPELVRGTLECRGAALYLFVPSTGTLVLRAQSGTALTEGSTLPLDSEALVASAARHSGVLQEAYPPHGHRAAVRLEHEALLLGVLYVEREGAALSRNDELLLQLLADRVSVLLEVVARFEQLGVRNDALAAERQAHAHFLALVAHDLRGPLFIARLAARALASGPGAVGPRMLATLQRALDRVDRMVTDLLDANRVKSGALLPLSLTRFDLGQMLRELVTGELSLAHGEVFDLDLPEAPVEGRWSLPELSRLVWNLAANAVKFGSRGGRVAIRLVDAGPWVSVSVHNQGPAIPAPMRERIFVPFSRLDERVSGWGLGLSLVKACAEAHGGNVEVQSDAESGTTFTVRLPREAPARTPGGPPRHEQQATLEVLH